MEDCNLGKGEPDAKAMKIYTLDGRIIVEGADGEAVHVFDALGRIVQNQPLPSHLHLIIVANRPPSKIIVSH